MLRNTKILHSFKNLTSTGTPKLHGTTTNVSIHFSLLTSLTGDMRKQQNLQEKSCSKEREEERWQQGEEIGSEGGEEQNSKVSQSTPSSMFAGSTNQ